LHLCIQSGGTVIRQTISTLTKNTAPSRWLPPRRRWCVCALTRGRSAHAGVRAPNASTWIVMESGGRSLQQHREPHPRCTLGGVRPRPRGSRLRRLFPQVTEEVASGCPRVPTPEMNQFVFVSRPRCRHDPFRKIRPQSDPGDSIVGLSLGGLWARASTLQRCCPGTASRGLRVPREVEACDPSAKSGAPVSRSTPELR
jgi:hypothetical protein